MRKGICCIVLSLTEQDNPIKFNTMTYAVSHLWIEKKHYLPFLLEY